MYPPVRAFLHVSRGTSFLGLLSVFPVPRLCSPPVSRDCAHQCFPVCAKGHKLDEV